MVNIITTRVFGGCGSLCPVKYKNKHLEGFRALPGSHQRARVSERVPEIKHCRWLTCSRPTITEPPVWCAGYCKWNHTWSCVWIPDITGLAIRRKEGGGLFATSRACGAAAHLYAHTQGPVCGAWRIQGPVCARHTLCAHTSTRSLPSPAAPPSPLITRIHLSRFWLILLALTTVYPAPMRRGPATGFLLDYN